MGLLDFYRRWQSGIPWARVAANWEGVDSPYGLPIPICYGVTWVSGIQVYSGPQFCLFFDPVANAITDMVARVYSTDEMTGDVSIEFKQSICQSAVIVLCEEATTVLDILKDGTSVNSATVDTLAERIDMISGHSANPGLIPPTGEDPGYFHGGTGAAIAHTRFDGTGAGTTAPYTYSTVARIDFCALAIGTQSARPALKFKVKALLASSDTVGAHPADVLVDLWTRAGKDPAKLDVETYYRAYVTGGGGSGSDEWMVNRTIDSETPIGELMQALLDETFSTAIKKETGVVVVVPRDVAVGGATALGVNDFLPVGAPPITVEMKQASDCFNCVAVDYEVTTATGTHKVRNEDTTFALANPFSTAETIRRAPPVNATWVSTAEHALNLSHLLAHENFESRATYKFQLHKRWVLLQEHDLLSLTEPHLGLVAKVVKIRRISEDGAGVISIDADEWLGQVPYTTPEVDPFDGFDGPLPGTPRDPYLRAVDDMASDSVFSASEHAAALTAWNDLYYSNRSVVAKCSSAGISSVTWTAALTALGTYLNADTAWTKGTPSWLEAPWGDITITAATWRTKWDDAYLARNIILSSVSYKPTGVVIPNAVSTTGTSGSTATILSDVVTVIPSGGSGAYSYDWSKVSGSTLTVTGLNQARFSASLANGTSASAVYRCTITDTSGQEAYANVSIYLGNYGSAPPLAATGSPLALLGERAGPGTQTVSSDYARISPTGGTSPYTYAWTKVSGDTMTPSSGGTSAVTKFSYSLAINTALTAVYRCTVTDAASDTVTVDVGVELSNFDD